jgi:hypothetical protein
VQLYDLRLEYFHGGAGQARIALSWGTGTRPRQVVPGDALYPPAAARSYPALHRVAMLGRILELTADEIGFVADHPVDFGGLDLDALPAAPAGYTTALFAGWELLHDLVELRESLSSSDVTAVDIVGAGAPASSRDRLAAARGWDATAVGNLAGAGGLAFTAADWRNSTRLLRLAAGMELAANLGVSVTQLLDWARNEPNPARAQAIKDAAKAQYDRETWLTVARPLMDRLRRAQRDALVAYLLPRMNLASADRLFDYFLIDAEMDPCMRTSRIKQAISSVQLFVQRCLLHLEPGVSPSSIDGKRWRTWMKRYRVWEANRKIFLYPENWIEPELRDAKTPFFEELESTMLQGDVTAESVESALLEYLRKLDEVARLEICGVYWQHEPAESVAKPEIDRLHVFGRTAGSPHVHYYRRLENGTTWTPWERLNLDIASDHLIPVVHDRRLYLFWALFAKVADPDANVPADDSGDKAPVQKWEIKLSWSELWAGKWSPRQTSVNSLSSWDFLAKEEHYFDARDEGGDLVIHCQHSRLAGTGAVGEFRFQACNAEPATTDFHNPAHGFQHFAVLPPHTEPRFQYLHDDEAPSTLVPITGDWVDDDTPGPDGEYWNADVNEIPALDLTATRYDLARATQYAQFGLQAPFFFQDAQRTYSVRPELVLELDAGIRVPTDARPRPDIDPSIEIPSLERDPKIPIDPGGPVERGEGPVILLPQTGPIEAQTRLSPELAMNSGIAPGQAVTTRALIIASGKRGELEKERLVAAPAVATPEPEWIAVRKAGYLERLADENLFHTSRFIPAVRRLRSRIQLRFDIHFHPLTCWWIKRLHRDGIPALLATESQLPTDNEANFRAYEPTDRVSTVYPVENADFLNTGAYSAYNWEIFFHVPMLLATRLSQSQRFEEAREWFHYVFDPTTNSTEAAPARYWNLLPFKTAPQDRIVELMADLSYAGTEPARLQRRHDLEVAVDGWRSNPFNPHRIARLRLAAYQKNVVMRYIDNLIAWGDMLFRQNTLETINEATQMYVLAGELLGPRPERIRPSAVPEPQSYGQLLPKLDAFSNALVTIENELPFASGAPVPQDESVDVLGSLGFSSTLYFCIPRNEKLLGYWDTVEDRLFKIRHCMNIEGVEQQLPLFEPPIDPGMLVRAAAGGGDLSAALSDLNAPLPQYRSSVLLQRALELCSEVKQLGAQLLSVLEKRDGEQLAALRASHEVALLKATMEIRNREVDEATITREGLEEAAKNAHEREKHYANLVEKGQRNASETEQVSQLDTAHDWQRWSQYLDLGASIAYAVPDFDIGVSGWAGSPVAKLKYGGKNVGNALSAASKVLAIIASSHTYASNRASVIAAWERRADEWAFQRDTAAGEQRQIAKQIDAAKAREEIAKTAVANQQKQIDQSSEVETLLREKFSNRDLYTWMSTQISAVYFQAYQLAFDLAKRAERAFRFERALSTSTYVQFGYWDNLHRGLLAGERLFLDLKRLEAAGLDQGKREYEIVKSVSLAQVNPMALMALKATGRCEVALPEAMFDVDYPGHYMRRIKSVSLTIPAVVGPYTSVNCTLTLLSSRIRVDSKVAGGYEEGEDDTRFAASFAAVQSIATSHAQSDSGMFDLNFHDERFLPFEGAGAVSRWRIELPHDTNAFDPETIADVVLRMSYTAREGGGALAEAARGASIAPAQEGVMRAFSLRQEFSTEWFRFLHPEDAEAGQSMALDLSKDRFPYRFRGRHIEITGVDAFLNLADGVSYPSGAANELIAHLGRADDPAAPESNFHASAAVMDGTPRGLYDFESSPQELGAWRLFADDAGIQRLPAALRRKVTVEGTDHWRMKAELVKDVILLVHYTAT